MKNSLIILYLTVLTILSACNMPAETTNDTPQDISFGTWNCIYMENGMYAAVPLVINENGTVEFQYKSGTWTFDSQTNTFSFSTDVPLQNAIYSADDKTLQLALASNQTIGGKTSISCMAPQ